MWQVHVRKPRFAGRSASKAIARPSHSVDTKTIPAGVSAGPNLEARTAMKSSLPSPANIEVIYSSETIAARIDALASEIASIKAENLLVFAVLKGSFVFAADLIRAMHHHGLAPEIDFLTLSSYRKSKTSSGQVTILRDLDLDVQGRTILLIDDILESGRTLAFAQDLLSARGASRIYTCVLLEKDVPRAVEVKADFRAFDCPEVFVVGYGMDVAHRFRELPFVGHIPPK